MIHKELVAGRIKGPFKDPPFKNFICSPLGIVPKKEPGKFRLIHDLSYPKTSLDSVNANIPKAEATVKYQLLDHVIETVQSQGPSPFMAKCDIQEAFRIVPLSPVFHHLLGFQFQNSFFYDCNLPMGLALSCSLFEKISRALVWILENKFGAKGISHILDDFIFISPSETSCFTNLQNFIHLASEVGIPIKHSKTVLPSRQIEAHGVLIDSVNQVIKLPDDKLQSCRSLLNEFSQRNKCTLQELQSLIGTLQFACKAIRPGRAFLRRLINLTVKATKPHHHIRLNSEAKADIQCWLNFLNDYNGTTIFLNNEWLSSETIKFFSDASGAKGYAVVFGRNWVAGPFPDSWKGINITVKELYPIVLGILLWGHTISNAKVLFNSDNEAVVHIINTNTSKDKQVMKLLRLLVLESLKHNILFRAKHIPGRHNVVPDLLSRLQFQKARAMAPWLSNQTTPVPASLSPQHLLP